MGGGTFAIVGGNLTIANQGSGGLNQNTILNLSGLTNFTFDSAFGTIGVGSVNRSVATLNLASGSNYLAAATINLNTGSTSSSGSSVALRFGDGTNVINASTINIAAGRTSATAQFAGDEGGLRLRGAGGTDTDRTTITLGHRNTGASAGGTTTGSLLLNGHPVDMMLETLTVGRNSRNGSEANLHGNGVFSFDQGTVDVVSIAMGIMSGTSPAASGDGTVTVGTNGKLLVQSVSLANVTSTATDSTGTGNLNILGGLVDCAGDIIKTTTRGVGSVRMDAGGRLNLTATGKLGTIAAPIDNLAMTNAILQIPVGNAYVTSLTMDGTSNVIHVIGDLPPVTGYPASMPLIQYAGALEGTFNVLLGTLPASSPAYAGYVSNNTTAGTIDLVLTGGPVPSRTLTWSGASSANWDTSTANWRVGTSATIYNQEDFVLFNDTATGPTTVLLTSQMLPSSITVSNQAKQYAFSGPGSISGGTGILKEGTGTLTITSSGFDDYTGNLVISGGTVRFGDGGTAGNPGTGSIVNEGSLVFHRSDDLTVATTITGAGTLTKLGSGTLVLGSPNAFSGATTVSAGTLSAMDNAALGSIDGATTISGGATLNVNDRNLGAEPIFVSGAGVGQAGAIVNNGSVQNLNALRYVTMTGDTTFGGPGRWDIRGAPSTADPANAALSTGGNAYRLTKVGPSQVSIVGATVDPMLSDIDIKEGILAIETATTGLGDPSKNVTIFPGAALQFYNLTNHLNKNIVINSDGTLPSIINGAGANNVIGPVTINNACTFNINGVSLALNGPVTGAAIAKNGTGNLIFGGSASHAGTIINSGKMIVSGTHSAPVTNGPFATLAGTGTLGMTDLSGALFPGDTNVTGTIAAQMLVLQPGAIVNLDLTSSPAVGLGSNDLVQVNGDLVVNGNTLNINAQELLRTKPGDSYTIITYTGNLVWNGDFGIMGPDNYTFAVDRTTPGQIKLVVSGGPTVWTGGSASTSNWSDPANWGGTMIQQGGPLYFDGTTRLVNNNDTMPESLYNELVFASTAGAFSLNGNPIMLGTSIANTSSSTQTVNLNITVGATATLGGPAGTLIMGGDVVSSANLSVLNLAGSGILSNRFVNANAVTNTLRMTVTNADWTILDNPSSAQVSVPMQLDIQAGSLSFGSAGSAPQFWTTSAQGVPAGDNRLGNISGAVATFNMVNGTLTTRARFNTGTAAGAAGVVNQSGGTWNLGGQLQGANGAATATSTINVSGGTMNVRDTGLQTLFVASRGNGILNVSGSGVVNCGTLDVSRSINSGISGTVNLNGGTLAVSRVSTATANAGASTTGSTGTVNFNGGILKANASSATWFQGRASGPAVPLSAIVKSGGAILDTDGFNISFLEPLQHDAGLGATPDGGLSKNGAGTLTLLTLNTYTGPTKVNAGTLMLNGILAASPVTVEAGGTLAGNGACGTTLVVNAGGTLSPGTSAGIAMMEISKEPRTNDLLRTVSGKIHYGGTLQVINLAGALAVGDSFKLFDAGDGYLGSFEAFDLPDVAGTGMQWNTSRLAVDGTLSLSAAPTVPVISSVTTSGGNIVMSGSGGMPGASYQVFSSTDIGAPLTAWTSVSTGQFDANGNFTVSIAVEPTTAKRFYYIRVP